MKILAIGDFHGKFPGNLKKEIKKEKIDLIVALGDYTGLPEWRPIVLKQLKAGRHGKNIPSPQDIIGKNKYKALVKKDFEAGLKILKEINQLGIPVLSLFGNGDWYSETKTYYPKTYEPYMKRFKNIKNINHEKTRFKGVNFIGWGGYMDIDAYFDKKHWKDDDKNSILIRLKRRNKARMKFFKLLRNLDGERIFLLHYTPKGFFDIIHGGKKNVMTGKSAGISFFNEAIKKYKPKLVFCGHMHEYQGKKWLGKSLVINPGDAERGRFAIIDSDNLNVRFVR